MNPAPTGPADDVDDIDDDQEDGLKEDDGVLPLACTPSMSGWCGQLHRHDRCYFNHPDGITAARAGTYGQRDGHQWICACPCHDTHDYPPCPHPNHHGKHERRAAGVDHHVQTTLFYLDVVIPLVPALRPLDGVEDRLLVGGDGGREGLLAAVDRDGR